MGRSSARAQATYFAPLARTSFQHSSPATAASRCTKREATVGVPASLAG
jgi:hypothetical protein